MDAQKSLELRERLAAIPRIAQRPVRWVAAAPSRVLNLGLAASWIGFLYTLGFFSASGETSTDPLTFADTLALLFFLVILGGIMAVVGLALANHRATAAVSAVSALAIVVLGATCGFAGHPVSAWGPDAALAGGIALASVAVWSRGEVVPAASTA